MNQERSIISSPQLELEMSGVQERGLHQAPARLPGKTHVSAVILSSNPWEQRNYDRQVAELTKLQVQKDRQHFWAQRQFLMTRAFDNDMNLRFANLKLQEDSDIKEFFDREIGSATQDSIKSQEESGVSDQLNDLKANPTTENPHKKSKPSRGIFAAPLTNNAISRTLTGKNTKANKKHSASGSKQSAALAPGSSTGERMLRRTGGGKGGHVRDGRGGGDRPEKGKSNLDEQSRVETDGRCVSGQKKNQAIPDLCDSGLLMALTQTLPSEMMNKANANMNADADAEKARQLDESRELSQRNALEDPRWISLANVLNVNHKLDQL